MIGLLPLPVPYLECIITEAPGEPAQINLVAITDDVANVVHDDKITVTIVDTYDNDFVLTGLVKVWTAYVQEKRMSPTTTSISSYGSEFWLGRRLIKHEVGPVDLGAMVANYIDTYCTPVTSGGINQGVGTNYEHPADFTSVLQMIEEARQNGYRSFCKYVSALNPEEMQFLKESTDMRAATREIHYGV